MTERKFATLINCIDGRTQEPAIEYVKNAAGVKWVDVITKPAVNKIIAELADDDPVVEQLRHSISISLDLHKSVFIAICAHTDCAGNPTDDNEQIDQIRHSVERLQFWYPELTVIGLWVSESGNGWGALKVG